MNLISKLFGNPGPEDWKQNKRNVIAMKRAIEKQMANSILQHHDIDQNRHAINEQNEILRTVTKEIINNENKISNLDNALTTLETFLELETMFDSIYELLESLIDIKRDAISGKCNEKGLNPEFLVEHLRNLESNKFGIAPVFASWEWQRYYSHELCSIALHNEELWITMRIPMINQAEKLVRTVPTSNQIWFIDEFRGLGLEVNLFKNQLHDSYMIILNSNLELCSKLGSTRVCNVRNTKFREANPFLVPLDINHDRVIVLSNSSASIEIKSICKNKPNSLSIHNYTLIRLPEWCTLMSKNLEVSKISNNINVTIVGTLNKIEELSHKNIRKPKSVLRNMDIRDLEELSKVFTQNNNDTERALNEIEYTNGWSSNKVLLTSSGSLSVIVAIIVVIIIVVLCKRKCKNSKNNVTIEFNENKLHEDNFMDIATNTKKSDFSCDTNDLASDDKSKKVSPQFKRRV